MEVWDGLDIEHGNKEDTHETVDDIIKVTIASARTGT